VERDSRKEEKRGRGHLIYFEVLYLIGTERAKRRMIKLGEAQRGFSLFIVLYSFFFFPFF
jgi:hypothetical protein